VSDQKRKAALEKLDDRLTAYLKDFVRAEVTNIPDQNYKLFNFSDGFQCYSNTAKIETELQYKEIFSDKEYFQHGIKIKDNDVIVDVGANIGMFVMFLMKNQSNIKVHAFEPIPDTFKTMEANIKLHDIKNVYSYNLALGVESAKEVKFTHYLNMTANTTMFPESKEFQKSRMKNMFTAEDVDILYEHTIVSAPMETLSSIIDQQGISQIDLLKIDVEGGECEVLKGIDSRHWSIIKQIVVEVHNAMEKLSEIKAIFKDKNIDINVKAGNTGPMDNCNLYCKTK